MALTANQYVPARRICGGPNSIRILDRGLVLSSVTRRRREIVSHWSSPALTAEVPKNKSNNISSFSRHDASGRR